LVIYYWQVNGANPHANFAGDTFIKLKVNPTPKTLRGNQFFVRILDGNRATLHVVEGDGHALTDIFGGLYGFFTVVYDLLQKIQHLGQLSEIFLDILTLLAILVARNPDRQRLPPGWLK
jgi:hypothetical protein